ncbi:asparaginase [Carbonactinospora thermoautotrophica]|uniref:asparaginase n=1 Tax=Carbonactinospora thermoautotrophica TaxID=1469144 RepID=UPI00226DCDAC|nr:asparaginase [Carbonactinospora thermoautotrophica]MCX9193240.1 asparaginase [Carbonactinospora thermoautotrophica]
MSHVPVLAEVVRSGFVESVHHGSLVALDADGGAAFAIGDVDSPVFPRSANKPMQAVGALRAGLDLDGELLALVAASHAGEPFHVEGVRRILAGAGLTEDALRTPPDLPLDQAAAAEALLRGDASPVTMNCSGKHAGMLAACVAAGWDTATYREPDHPLQVLIRQTLEELAGEKVAHTGVDGCGAPVLAISLAGLARAFRRLVSAEPGTYERRVADAMRAHPEYVDGTGRMDTRLMSGIPGLLAKGGAEGVYALALADGRAVAFKIADGAARARPAVAVAALRRLGAQAPVLEELLASCVVLGGGRPVGEIRAVGL